MVPRSRLRAAVLRQLIPASEQLGFAIVRGVDRGLDFEAAIENLRAALEDSETTSISVPPPSRRR